MTAATKEQAKHMPGTIRAAWLITKHVGTPLEIAGVPQTLNKFPAVKRAAEIIDRETAAPDLLAACKAALEQLRIDHEAAELTGGCGNHPLMEKLHWAIAKAE